jgi:Right handed beta helix region
MMLWLIVTVLVLFSSVGHAATITAASCHNTVAQPDVRTALLSARDGDTVIIPAGTCDLEGNTLTVVGGVSIQGAGKTDTVLRGSSGTGALITIDCSNRKSSSFSDMTLVGKATPAIRDGGLTLANGCKDFKVFNSKFTDFGNHGISVVGNSRGVIFNNEFIDNFRESQVGGAMGYGVVVYGDGTWPPLELGTANAVFIEDNFFSGNRHDIASNNGSRYVFRYNTVIVTPSVRHFPMVDAHGHASSPRGSRSWEIYNNTFSTNLPPKVFARSAVGIRGGDGVVFNNVITSSSTVRHMIDLKALEIGPTYPTMDQMRSGYFWDNTPSTLLNEAPGNLVEGRDYFLYARPGYKSYTYPHPLTMTHSTGGATK